MLYGCDCDDAQILLADCEARGHPQRPLMTQPQPDPRQQPTPDGDRETALVPTQALREVLIYAYEGHPEVDDEAKCQLCSGIHGHQTEDCFVHILEEAVRDAESTPEPQWSQEWPTKKGWYHRWKVGRQVESYFLPINEIQSDMARKYMIDYWWLPATGRYQVPEPPKPQEGGR